MNALVPGPLRVSGQGRSDHAKDAPLTGPVTVAFVLLAGFDMLSLTAGREPFRLANHHAGAELFRILHISSDGGPVTSCQAIEMPVDAALSNGIDADLTLVLGAAETSEPIPPVVPAQLRRLWRTGKSVGAVQGGVIALAQAGVLAGNRFAAKPEHLTLLQMRWPKLSHVDQLYCIHNRILTCVGGFAAADLSLRVIHDLAGPTTAEAAMLACQMTTIRDEATAPAMQCAPKSAHRNPYLRRALRWIERNFAQEDCLSTLPEAAGASARHLQRLFKAHLGLRPVHYLLDLRLNRARILLSETDLSVTNIAEACGFGTTGTFSKYFRQKFGVAPSRYSPFGTTNTSWKKTG